MRPFATSILVAGPFAMAICAVALPGQAQNIPPLRAGETAPPSSDRSPPGGTIEPGISGSSSEPLSDKLDRSSGVIHPPAAIDAGIAKSPPAVGPESTPVIPPPGTPGGRPGENPK